MQQRTGVPGILGLLPYALPQGIGKTTLPSARFTQCRRVDHQHDMMSRPLDTYVATFSPVQQQQIIVTSMYMMNTSKEREAKQKNQHDLWNPEGTP
eukprot:1141000-Pelagomonas_calceolata.AAC.6